jgi:hypothetical protein
MPMNTDEKVMALSRDVIAAFDKANGGILQARPCERPPAQRHVYTGRRGRIVDAGAAPSAELHPCDGALF